MKLFNTEFEKAKRESIIDFSVISLVIMERQDLNRFKEERKKCPNRIDKILYHGTSFEPISCILTNVFKKSECSCQFGKGVYFTDILDYSWFYGSPLGNRENGNKIPRINESFTLIACLTYYNNSKKKNKFMIANIHQKKMKLILLMLMLILTLYSMLIKINFMELNMLFGI